MLPIGHLSLLPSMIGVIPAALSLAHTRHELVPGRGRRQLVGAEDRLVVPEHVGDVPAPGDHVRLAVDDHPRVCRRVETAGEPRIRDRRGDVGAVAVVDLGLEPGARPLEVHIGRVSRREQVVEPDRLVDVVLLDDDLHRPARVLRLVGGLELREDPVNRLAGGPEGDADRERLAAGGVGATVAPARPPPCCRPAQAVHGRRCDAGRGRRAAARTAAGERGGEGHGSRPRRSSCGRGGELHAWFTSFISPSDRERRPPAGMDRGSLPSVGRAHRASLGTSMPADIDGRRRQWVIHAPPERTRPRGTGFAATARTPRASPHPSTGSRAGYRSGDPNSTARASRSACSV